MSPPLDERVSRDADDECSWELALAVERGERVQEQRIAHALEWRSTADLLRRTDRRGNLSTQLAHYLNRRRHLK